MPVTTKDVCFFEEESFIRVSHKNQPTNVWAVGSYQQRPVLLNMHENPSKPTLEYAKSLPALVFFDDLLKFCPYLEYDENALKLAYQMAKKG